MKKIWAETALLPSGWANNVCVGIGADGRISGVDVGVPQGEVDHVVGLLLPAPVNAHSHSFQRAMAGLTERRGPDPSDSFWTWRQLMYRFLDHLTPDHVEAIAAFVQMEMLEAGYATNAEFHYLHHQPDGMPYANLSEMSERIVAATARTGIGLCLLPVHYEFGGCDGRALGAGQVRFGNDLGRFEQLQSGAAKAVSQLPPDCAVGVAPHSLRAVGARDLAQYHSVFGDGPIHMHLAEQSAEVEEVQALWGARPVEWALDNMALDERWCLIHCTQMTPDETVRLAQTGAVAGLCPITESSLGDGIFDGVRWVSHGGALAIGSDSNIRISLSEELRTLDYSQRLRDRSRAAFASPDRSTGRRLFEDVVKGGGQAVQRATGCIETGYWADLLSIDMQSEHVLGRQGDTVLDSWIFASDDRLVQDVWSAGRYVVQGGQHIERASIVAQYRGVMHDLRGLL